MLLLVYSYFKHEILGEMEADKILLVSQLLMQTLEKVLWTVSNIYAESENATKALTLDKLKVWADLVSSISMNFQGLPYHRGMRECFFVLSNLVTECDPQHLLRVLMTHDADLRVQTEIVGASVKLLE